MAKTKLQPPPAPKLPSTEDVAKASLPALGSEGDEEQGEQTDFDTIRGHLEEAHTALTSAYEALDRLEAEQS